MNVRLYDTDYNICNISIEKYANNNNIAIQLYSDSEGYPEPFATLTVNLVPLNSDKLAYIDANNCPWAVDFIKEYNLGTPTGNMMGSGYCTYPEYEMNLEELKKYE